MKVLNRLTEVFGYNCATMPYIIMWGACLCNTALSDELLLNNTGTGNNVCIYTAKIKDF